MYVPSQQFRSWKVRIALRPLHPLACQSLVPGHAESRVDDDPEVIVWVDAKAAQIEQCVDVCAQQQSIVGGIGVDPSVRDDVCRFQGLDRVISRNRTASRVGTDQFVTKASATSANGNSTQLPITCIVDVVGVEGTLVLHDLLSVCQSGSLSGLKCYENLA